MHPFVNTALKAARKAGDIILQSLERLDTIHATAKGHHDFVTDIDRRAEKEILSLLKRAYPDHAFLAEESGEHVGNSDAIWIIDPLDGTHNYMRGFPHFSVSIALQLKGRIEHGLVYDPIRQEVFSASRGHGARCNDRRVRVSTTTQLENALVATGFSVRNPENFPSYLQAFTRLLPQVSDIRVSGSAALDLCYVAASRTDAFFQTHLGPWDMAAGSLIVKEAGGLVSDWEGEEKHLEKGAIVAANPKIFSLLLPLLTAHQKVPV
jgi:myo-inositol-1(or 4)-monophosphatase